MKRFAVGNKTRASLAIVTLASFGDYTHDSRYGKAKGNRWLGAMGRIPEVVPYRTDLDKKCLTYTSEPLATDLEVTGHPIVTMFVTSTANYGDFYVYLEQVDEEGRALMVTEGVHRAGFAAMVDNDEIIMGGGSGVDVKPDLPWHGYEKKDYTDAVFAGGRILEMTFDLHPTSWVFKKGRRIRVSISLSDWPTFRLHERLAPGNDPRNPANVIPAITIHRGEAKPSRIALPVIPR